MVLSQGITINTEQIIYICTLVAAVWAVYLKEQEETNRMILQCMLDLINHEITGNGIDKLKERRDSLQEFLINK